MPERAVFVGQTITVSQVRIYTHSGTVERSELIFDGTDKPENDLQFSLITLVKHLSNESLQ